jgi:hypothetical protein
MNPELPTSRVAPWLWAALSVAVWVASFFVAFTVLAGASMIGLLVPDVGGLRTELAVLLGLYGILAASGALAAARLVFRRWPAVGARDAIVPLIGLALAMAVELGLHAWTTSRFTYYDWDMVGWTALLSFMLVALAVATLAVLVAPRGSALPPLVAQVAGAMLVGLIVLSNVGGITDGVEPESWPLAILVGLSAVYAAVVVVIGARRVSTG